MTVGELRGLLLGLPGEAHIFLADPRGANEVLHTHSAAYVHVYPIARCEEQQRYTDCNAAHTVETTIGRCVVLAPECAGWREDGS